ncbi:histone deacetylase family protein [Mesonia aestuariivivens]|uniref:Histone deacetylase n=1 Tax=Mesonia aestuariivivens TaxID=2796128 RepID=A0ABS6W355_9FLAO|nr:histone deacetylase [Mesonia aestuariivivens]MBW2961931.1 histone deacetylase [Mesonia aestuariivivens]
MLKIAFHPSYVYPLPARHRFPMEKYELLPQQLLLEGTCSEENFFEPKLPNDKYICDVHDVDYYYDFLNLKLTQKEIRRTGFPLSRELVWRERLIAGGTIMAAEFALQYGIAMNIAGGTHHAYTNRGEGFCMLNDQAIAARYLQQHNLAEKILIVDLDVHQGNGTAEIFENDDSVFTFSMHCESNYPFKKEKSNLDIGLPNQTEGEEYLKILKETLPKLIEMVAPDFVFYLSGVDVLATDKLGKLSLSIDDCKERDRFVLQSLKDKNLPVECSMGGGYSKEIKHIVEAHANTYRLAQKIFF